MAKAKKVEVKKVDVTKAAEVLKEGIDNMLVDKVVEVANEKANENQPIELEATNEENKPVTLTGKTVPLSATGKVRLLNTSTNKIITGLIDQKLAQEQVNQFKHIQIVNEAEYAKGQNK